MLYLLFLGVILIFVAIEQESVPFIIVGVIIVLIGVFVFLIKRWKKDFDLKQRKIKEYESRKMYIDCMPGEYLFPVQRFYLQCKMGKWTKTENEVHIKKMILIAKSLMKEDGVESREVFETYTSKEQVTAFYVAARNKEIEKKEKSAKALEEKKKVPQDTNLSSDDRDFRVFNEKCKDYKYADKRKESLKYLISLTEGQLRRATAKFNAARKTSDNVYAATKGKDWAIAGGIANAIAGPAAGVMVASEIIKENERNEPMNQLTRNYAWSKQSEASQNLAKVKSTLEKYKRELSVVDTKIIFDEINTEELYKYLKIKAEMSGGFGRLNLSITNNYSENSDIKTVIDGTVQVAVFCDGLAIDEVCVALPYNGVACNKTQKAHTFLNRAMIGKREYTFEIKPNMLWLMEK